MRPYLELNQKLAYASEKELDWLVACVAERPDAVVVMIGAGPGVMALALLDEHKPITLHVIDNALSHTFKIHLEQANMDLSRVHIHQDDSHAIGSAWTEQDIDLLIVDGDHSYEGVMRDLRVWWPHVKLDGIVFLHDYYRKGAEWDGIMVAAKEFLEEHKYAYKNVKSLDSTRIVKRLR